MRIPAQVLSQRNSWGKLVANMNNKKSDVGNILANALHLSSPETHKQDKAKEKNRSQYRRKYWQDYAKRVKRIFGTVSFVEYEAAKQRAEEAGRSVWGQIWAEAKAYREQTILSNFEIASQQRELAIEIRRIGNNINQLAKLGHIQARKHGGLRAISDDRIGVETLRQFEKLEAKVARFDDGMTIRIQAA